MIINADGRKNWWWISSQDCLDFSSCEMTKFKIQRNVGKASNRVRTPYFRRRNFYSRYYTYERERYPREMNDFEIENCWELSSAGVHEISAEDPADQEGHFSMNRKTKWKHTGDDNMGRQESCIKAFRGYRGIKSDRQSPAWTAISEECWGWQKGYLQVSLFQRENAGPLMEWQGNLVEGVKENAEVFNTLDISLHEENLLLAFDSKASEGKEQPAEYRSNRIGSC